MIVNNASDHAHRTGVYDNGWGSLYANTFEDLLEGMKRKRKMQFVRLPTAYLAAQGCTCGVCGGAIDESYRLNPDSPDDLKMVTPDPDGYTMVHFFPKTKRMSTAHYYCGWGALIGTVIELGDRLR